MNHLRQRLHRLFPQLRDGEIGKLAEDQGFVEFLEQARSYHFTLLSTQHGKKRAIQLHTHDKLVKVYPLE